MAETRVVNQKTGGEKGAKPGRMSLVPMDVILRHVAPHYVKGAEKYAPDNWRRGYDWSLSFDALCRHLEAFWYERQENDEETGTRHLAAVVFHALALLYFGDVHPDLDDRPRLDAPEEAPEADLSAYVSAVAEVVATLASETGVPPHYLAPSWGELDAERMDGAVPTVTDPQPCPFRGLNNDGVCSMADHFASGYEGCRPSCQVAEDGSRS